MDVITVGVVHDTMLMRVGIRCVIERDPGFRVVGEDDTDAVGLARELEPDVLILSLHQSAIENTTEAVCRAATGTRVLLLAESVREDAMRRAVQAGAAGVLERPGTPALLLSAIRVVAGGDTVLPAVTVRVAMAARDRDETAVEGLSALTPREREVLLLLASGLGNLAIGRALFVSESAVKTHVSNILGKLRCENRVQAALLTYQAGLIAMPVNGELPWPCRNSDGAG